jgi:hypothetical protein
MIPIHEEYGVGTTSDFGNIIKKLVIAKTSHGTPGIRIARKSKIVIGIGLNFVSILTLNIVSIKKYRLGESETA